MTGTEHDGAGSPKVSTLGPFDRFYGLELLTCSAQEVTARLAVADHHKQPLGSVHGGVYAAIAEFTASAGTNAGVNPAGHYAVGQVNSTNFLRPVSSGMIHAQARVVHSGRRSWVWDVTMTDDAGRVCAISRMTLAVITPS